MKELEAKYVIVYDAKNHTLSREKLDLQNPDAIGDRLDLVGSEMNMYNTKPVGFKNEQKLVVYYNHAIDWEDQEAYSPIGFMGEVFNNIIIVAAYEPVDWKVVDIDMTINEAFAEVKNFTSCEFGWETVGFTA